MAGDRFRVGLTEAARLAGVHRTTVLRAIAAGRLSQHQDARGRRLVDVAELERVFGALRAPAQERAPHADAQAHGADLDRALADLDRLRADLENERAERERLAAELRDWQREYRDLARRLLLTGPPPEPTAPPAPAEEPPPPRAEPEPPARNDPVARILDAAEWFLGELPDIGFRRRRR